MREAELEADKLLPRVGGLAGALFDSCTVSDTYETQNRRVSFRDADDVAVQESPGRAYSAKKQSVLQF